MSQDFHQLFGILDTQKGHPLFVKLLQIAKGLILQSMHVKIASRIRGLPESQETS